METTYLKLLSSLGGTYRSLARSLRFKIAPISFLLLTLSMLISPLAAQQDESFVSIDYEVVLGYMGDNVSLTCRLQTKNDINQHRDIYWWTFVSETDDSGPCLKCASGANKTFWPKRSCNYSLDAQAIKSCASKYKIATLNDGYGHNHTTKTTLEIRHLSSEDGKLVYVCTYAASDGPFHGFVGSKRGRVVAVPKHCNAAAAAPSFTIVILAKLAPMVVV